MSVYEKAYKALKQAGHHVSIIQQESKDVGIWIEVWNSDLGECHEFRIHDEEVTWWAEYYEEQQNEKQ